MLPGAGSTLRAVERLRPSCALGQRARRVRGPRAPFEAAELVRWPLRFIDNLSTSAGGAGAPLRCASPSEPPARSSSCRSPSNGANLSTASRSTTELGPRAGAGLGAPMASCSSLLGHQRRSASRSSRASINRPDHEGHCSKSLRPSRTCWTLPAKESRLFLAGGEYPYPVDPRHDGGGNTANAVGRSSFKEFGVTLKVPRPRSWKNRGDRASRSAPRSRTLVLRERPGPVWWGFRSRTAADPQGRGRRWNWP
jgi:hypothetical protein